jgi:RHS repeat-associated protein
MKCKQINDCRTDPLTLASAASSYSGNDWVASDLYDSNGNTTNCSGAVYQYDAENHLTNYNNGAALMRYDADGNRVSKTVNGATTYYLVDERNPSGYGQVLAELTGAGNQSPSVQRTYVYGLSLVRQVSTLTSQPSTSYYGADGHGSVRFLMDSGGTVTDTYTYDAYGNQIGRLGSTTNNYLYCGEQYDPDLGFYYLRARYYQPQTGRFWTMDSYEGNTSDPLSLHKYAYCCDSPVNRCDPGGNQSATDLVTRGDVAKLRKLIATWRGRKWDFAADMLQHFLGNSGTHLNVYKHHLKVKLHEGWRNHAQSEIVGTEHGSKGAIGDPKLANLTAGANLSDNQVLGLQDRQPNGFTYRFGGPDSALTDNDELFYALYGAHFSYYAKVTKLQPLRFRYDVKIVLWDQITFPSGMGGVRNIFSDYAAAAHLQAYGYRSTSRLYAVWDDQFEL